MRFGLYEVDFETQERKLRDGAKCYGRIIQGLQKGLGLCRCGLLMTVFRWLAVACLIFYQVGVYKYLHEINSLNNKICWCFSWRLYGCSDGTRNRTR